jgi:hypothetical protein
VHGNDVRSWWQNLTLPNGERKPATLRLFACFSGHVTAIPEHDGFLRSGYVREPLATILAVVDRPYDGTVVGFFDAAQLLAGLQQHREQNHVDAVSSCSSRPFVADVKAPEAGPMSLSFPRRMAEKLYIVFKSTLISFLHTQQPLRCCASFPLTLSLSETNMTARVTECHFVFYVDN